MGLDARDGLLAVEGWTETSKTTALNVARSPGALNPAAIIYTDISPGRGETGGEYPGHPALAQATDIPVIASGGVSSLEDIRALLPLEPLGVIGVITGRALYDGSLDLEEAIRLAREE